MLRQLRGVARLTNARPPKTPHRLPFQISHLTRRREFHVTSSREAVKLYNLADIGEGITECQIVSWSVKPGDQVEQFDPICEVQSDKATVEITSRYDGTVKELLYQEGDTAAVGQPLLSMDIIDDVESDEPLSQEKSEQPETEARYGQVDAAGFSNISNTELQPAKRSDRSGGSATLFTPALQRNLTENKVEISDITGTGHQGRVTQEDNIRHMSASRNTSMTELSNNSELHTISEEDDVYQFTHTERAMFKVMTKSLKIPHFLFTHTVDFTSTNLARRKINSKSSNSSEVRLTPLAFVIKALSEVMLKYPKLNSHVDEVADAGRPRLILRKKHNFGVAIDTPKGLLVPVVKDIQSRSVRSVAAELRKLNDLAQAGRLAPEDFNDVTFTVSNIGSIAGDTVAPIIVPPTVAIVGIGTIRKVPVFIEDSDGKDSIEKVEQMTISWSADHRVLDGATVARAAKEVESYLMDVINIDI